ncbi:unnamed protein product [Rotaria socialis]|uniref:Uncharacterized protein n=1 Tax=Rotaria socialis TaxID=392032 RepID=A0A818WC11_9BILA|nr:unnamed protein product [Rotaria socialis]
MTNSGTTHLKQHSCVIDGNMKISTQTPIDKRMLARSIYGNIDVNDILRGRTVISTHIQSASRSCRQRIKDLLQEPYNSRCLSISPDFWCDKYKQVAYLSVTVVIVDKDFKYYTIGLFCKPFQES